MKTRLMILSGVLSGIIACTPSADKEAQHALTAYTHFVDSIYQVNETWKMAIDTDFVETPIDPEDPTITILDTIVTLPGAKDKSIVIEPYWGKIITEQYSALKTAVESKAEKMDETMKKEYAEANAKFET
jgi:hypothetical protein